MNRIYSRSIIRLMGSIRGRLIKLASSGSFETLFPNTHFIVLILSHYLLLYSDINNYYTVLEDKREYSYSYTTGPSRMTYFVDDLEKNQNFHWLIAQGLIFNGKAICPPFYHFFNK